MKHGVRSAAIGLYNSIGARRIILIWIFKMWDGGMDWIDLAQDRGR
jgi:hypothetical protein